MTVEDKINLAYGRHWISWHVRLVAPIPQNCHFPIQKICHMSLVTCHLSPDHHSIHLQLLWKSQEDWWWIKLKKNILLFFCSHIEGKNEQTHTQTAKEIFRLNWRRSQFQESCCGRKKTKNTTIVGGQDLKETQKSVYPKICWTTNI